jgi:SAM-dependent methyltransferase
MGEDDRVRWNQRYRQDAYDFSPPDWLAAFAPRLTPSRTPARALDLASGPGRNSLFLAQLGYTVDAWDISDVALELLTDEAKKSPELRIAPRLVDLDNVDLPPDTYDLVLDAHYLDRRLFPSMQRALMPGGLLLVHTFLQPPSGRYNPEHALEPGELRRVFSELTELDYGEDAEHETAWLLAQRRAAPP